MKLLMLCREPRLYSCQRLKQAAENRGCSMDILDPNRFVLGLAQGQFTAAYQHGEQAVKSFSPLQPLPPYQGILGRFGTASTAMGCRVLHHFELQGIPALNGAEAFTLARDKWQSLQQLAAHAIPIADSQFAGALVSTRNSANSLPAPQVLKTLSGSQGVGVMLTENPSTTESLLATLQDADIPVLQQAYIREAAGQDIRAFVIGNKVVAAMCRQGKSGDFRANIHQGGSAEKIELTLEEQQLAVKAVQAIGLDVAGVDLIRSHQGLMVLEVNASPGLEMIEKVSGEPIAEKMIDFLIAKIRQKSYQAVE